VSWYFVPLPFLQLIGVQTCMSFSWASMKSANELMQAELLTVPPFKFSVREDSKPSRSYARMIPYLLLPYLAALFSSLH
jgi:hypothetical protein